MDEEQEHKERRRPRVVDKRVSARTEEAAGGTGATGAGTGDSATSGADASLLRSDSPRSATSASLRNSPEGRSAPPAANSGAASPDDTPEEIRSRREPSQDDPARSAVSSEDRDRRDEAPQAPPSAHQ